MTTIKFKRGTSTRWTSVNPILAAGEPGYDTTNKKFKIGDGTSTWTQLPFQDTTYTPGTAIGISDQNAISVQFDSAKGLAVTGDSLGVRVDGTTIDFDPSGNLKAIGGGGGGSLSPTGSATQPIYIDANGDPQATTYELNKTVPSDAVFTDTTYTHFTGATSLANGSQGLVPAPIAGDQTKFLCADGTWQTVSGGGILTDSETTTITQAGSYNIGPYICSSGILVDTQQARATISASTEQYFIFNTDALNLQNKSFDFCLKCKTTSTISGSDMPIFQEAPGYNNKTCPQMYILNNKKLVVDIPNADGSAWLVDGGDTGVTVNGNDELEIHILSDASSIQSKVIVNGDTTVIRTIANSSYVCASSFKACFGAALALTDKIQYVDLAGTYLEIEGVKVWETTTESASKVNVKYDSDTLGVDLTNGLYVKITENVVPDYSRAVTFQPNTLTQIPYDAIVECTALGGGGTSWVEADLTIYSDSAGQNQIDFIGNASMYTASVCTTVPAGTYVKAVLGGPTTEAKYIPLKGAQ